MNERIRFVIAQKKRYLNEISSRIAKFKLEGKDLGVYVTVKADGNLSTPRDFVDECEVLTSAEQEKLTKKERAKYEEKYAKSTRYLIVCYNDCNKKFESMFAELSKQERADVLKYEVNALQGEDARAKAYCNALTREWVEKKQKELGFKGQLSDEQVKEYVEEVSQTNYMKDQLKFKQNALAEYGEF